MTWSSFAWDLPRNVTIICSLFFTKFILKNLYFVKNSLYKKPLLLRETAREPQKNICCGYSLQEHQLGSCNEYHSIYFCGEIRKISVLFD